MSISAGVKVIGRPPTVVLSAALEARVAAVLRSVATTKARVSGPERIDPAVIWPRSS